MARDLAGRLHGIDGDRHFFTSEWPAFVCTDYNDSFIAYLSSKAFNGGKPDNISFDAQKNPVSVNNGFFDRCTPNTIIGCADGQRVGFLHLQTTTDFFTGASNCHISDLAVATGHDGKGVGGALIAYAERWAREHHCRHVTLAVFPGNARARALYAKHGFGEEMIRMAKAVK